MQECVCMARKSGIITSSFTRSLCFTLCLTLILSGVPLPARTQSNQPSQGGLRTTGAPSPNLPNLDTTRRQKEPAPKAPAQTPAKRCRWFDAKCKQAKEKKTENNITPNRRGFGVNGERLIA